MPVVIWYFNNLGLSKGSYLSSLTPIPEYKIFLYIFGLYLNKKLNILSDNIE